MKVTELFEEDGKGKQVFQFLDYLNTRCPFLNKTDRERLRKFGTHLFKKGWTYSIGPSNGDFSIGTNEVGRHRLVTPEVHWKGRRDELRYFYYMENQHESPTTVTSQVTIDELDYMLEELRDIDTAPPV